MKTIILALLFTILPAHAQQMFRAVRSTPGSPCQASPTGLPALGGTLPNLPASCYAPPLPQPWYVVNVNSSAALTAALVSPACGTMIVCQAGVTYGSTFTYSAVCPPINPVVIVSSTAANFPPYTPISQSLAGTSAVATIATSNTNSPFFVADNASGLYVGPGIEFTLASNAGTIYPIVAMGEQTSTAAALPQYITFDRVLIHPAPCTNDTYGSECNYVSRGIDLNAVNGTLEYSQVWSIVNAGQDAQAVNVNNTTGPLLIAGNFLEATGENIISNTECTVIVPPNTGSQGYTTGDIGITNCPVPSDVTVRLNHFKKLLAWETLPAGCNSSESQCYDVKNVTEIKHGQRWLYDSNIYDTTYAGGQAEFLISNCFYPGIYVCQDITYTNNLFEHGPQVGAVAGNGAAQVCGASNQPPCTSNANGISTGTRFLFRGNLAVDIDGVTYGGAPCSAGTSPPYINCSAGAAFQIQYTYNWVSDHNTYLNKPNPNTISTFAFSDGQPSTDIGFQKTNEFQFGQFFNDGGCSGCAIAALPSPTLGGDIMVGDYYGYPNIFNVPYSPAYPAGIFSLASSTVSVPGSPPITCQNNGAVILSCWPLDWALVGFTDFTGAEAGTDLPGAVLTSGSPYHNAGTDGLDIGVNVSAVLKAIGAITW